MKVYEYTPDTLFSGKRVVALGFFDGVHLGHREILECASTEAKRLSVPSAVFTFRSETDAFKGKKRIYGTEDKASLIAECSIDEMIVANFEDIREVPAEDFVNGVLIGDLGCISAVCGADFRFGRGAMGNRDLLFRLMENSGGRLISADDVTVGGEKVSTTRIKKLLSEGDVRGAAELLSSPYFVKRRIKHGLGLGRSFGFPTVNTDITDSDPDLMLGVYKCACEIDGVRYNALTNVGTCPTVGERQSHRETFILGLHGDLYDKEIKISFLDFIRKEKQFESVERLIMQINIDIKTAFESEER